EDGIRDFHVTGVQTCALPILLLVFAIVVLGAGWALAQTDAETPVLGVRVEDDPAGALVTTVVTGSPADAAGIEVGDIVTALDGEIGRASCRERGEGWGGGGAV